EPEAVGPEALRGVDDELDGAGPGVVDGPRRAHRGLAHGAAHGLVHARRRRLLDDLLVAALQRAVAFEQVHGIAVRIAEHLHLDVARRRHVFFNQHAAVAEGGLGLAASTGQRGGEVGGAFDPAHTFAAAAGARLDEYRVADLGGATGEELVVLLLAVVAGDDRHPGLFHQALGGLLQAHGGDRRCRGTDEDDAGGVAGLDEVRVLGQRAVAGVDGGGAAAPGGVDDAVDAKVALGCRRGADAIRLVGRGDMQGVAVGVGV